MTGVSDDDHAEDKAQFEEQELERQQQAKARQQEEHHATLSSAYGSGSYSKRIGKLGMTLIVLLFCSWIFFTVVLIMSYLPFSKGLFNSLIDFRY